MNLKNFKKGDQVFVLHDRVGMNRRNQNVLIAEGFVQTVGRKYVTVEAGCYNRKFKEWHEENYLLEEVSYGTACLLFKSREAIEEHLEKESLEMWLASKNFNQIKNYSLEQLRKVKEILGD